LEEIVVTNTYNNLGKQLIVQPGSQALKVAPSTPINKFPKQFFLRT